MKQKREPEVSGVSSLFNMLPCCCSSPISICRYHLPATESSVDAHGCGFCFFFLLDFRIILSFSNYLDPPPSSSCFGVRIVIRSWQRNRRVAREQLSTSNYKTLGKRSADALHRHPPPSSFLPPIWSDASVTPAPHGVLLLAKWPLWYK